MHPGGDHVCCRRTKSFSLLELKRNLSMLWTQHSLLALLKSGNHLWCCCLLSLQRAVTYFNLFFFFFPPFLFLLPYSTKQCFTPPPLAYFLSLDRHYHMWAGKVPFATTCPQVGSFITLYLKNSFQRIMSAAFHHIWRNWVTVLKKTGIVVWWSHTHLGAHWDPSKPKCQCHYTRCRPKINYANRVGVFEHDVRDKNLTKDHCLNDLHEHTTARVI